MSVLVLPIAISGAGKTFLGEQLKKHLNISIVCMDDLRKQLTDSYSDQSRNQEVWVAAQTQLMSKLKSGKTVYFSATNLSGSKLASDIESYLNRVEDLHIVLVPFKDSYDKDLCRSRVIKDFDNNIDRADTRDEHIIDRQHSKFLATMDAVDEVKDLYPDTVTVTVFDKNVTVIAETIKALI